MALVNRSRRSIDRIACSSSSTYYPAFHHPHRFDQDLHLSPTTYTHTPPPLLASNSDDGHHFCFPVAAAPTNSRLARPAPSPAAGHRHCHAYHHASNSCIPPPHPPPSTTTTSTTTSAASSLAASTSLVSLLALVALLKLAAFLHACWWRPLRIRRLMRAQGIHGPPPRFMVGNLAERNELRRAAVREDMSELSHDIVPRLMPDYVNWSQAYGKRFVFWWGTEARLVVYEAEEIRQVLVSRSGCFRRSELQRRGVRHFIGGGLLMANGDAWAYQRRLLSPVFHHSRLKAHVGSLVECTMETVVQRWERLLQDREAKNSNCGIHDRRMAPSTSETFHDEQLEQVAVEVEAGDEMNWLAADMITRTQFGSSLGALGKGFFDNLTELQKLCTQTSQYRGGRWSRMKKVKGDIEASLLAIIEARRQDIASKSKQIMSSRKPHAHSSSKVNPNGETHKHDSHDDAYGNDLLGVLLREMESTRPLPSSIANGPHHLGRHSYTLQRVLDECKTFFFTGYDTIGLLLTWTLMLLASNPLWQDRAREEILRVTQGACPDAEMLNKLKIVGMVLWESLRLYPPAAMLAREAAEEVVVGGVRVPKGVSVWIPALALHHDPVLWGPTAHLFDPSRFASQFSQSMQSQSSSSSSLFLPFSAGPRVCVGQQAALLHARLALTVLLQRFSFALSPRYRHAPLLHLTLRPRHGLPLLLSRASPPAATPKQVPTTTTAADGA